MASSRASLHEIYAKHVATVHSNYHRPAYRCFEGERFAANPGVGVVGVSLCNGGHVVRRAFCFSQLGCMKVAEIQGLSLVAVLSKFVMAAIDKGTGSLAATVASQLLWQVPSKDTHVTPLFRILFALIPPCSFFIVPSGL